MASMTQTATCFVVDKTDGKLTRGIHQTSLPETPGADVLIDVEYSALNYKDALASDGHPGVALSLRESVV